MAEPLRLRCASPEDAPSAETLRELVTEERHVVLHFPLRPGVDAESLVRPVVERLTARLPDYTVFSAGVSDNEASVTVIEVLPERVILEHANAIAAAARQFRRTANQVMERLAQRLGTTSAALSRDPLFRLQGPGPQIGQIDSEWRYWFHGLLCCLMHQGGSVLDIEVGYPDEFGVLDPWFFLRFAQTTPGLEEVAGRFRNSYHVAARALEVLERHGYLRRIPSVIGGRTGLVVADG